MISFSGIDFRYRRSSSVFTNFSWKARHGATVLLGPNGVGKSTLFQLAAAALIPQKGEIDICGLKAGRRKDRNGYAQALGWMPQRIEALPSVTAFEQLCLYGWFKGLDSKRIAHAASKALELVGLDVERNKLAKQLSGGQLRRLGLAQAIVHSPEVVLLDEPTAGLDPAQRRRFRELLSVIPAATVIVSTHQVDDVHEIFDYVALVSANGIVFDSSIESFLEHAPLDVKDPGERNEAAYAALHPDLEW